jgi:hypothetical protein
MSTPNVLLDVFVPPQGMVGYGAALVAMTGAEDFLEAAVQRFCGLRPRQRAELGQVLVYLMLDGHASPSRQQVFPPGRIPGLHEFQPRPVAPGSLLHSKLALLGFSRNRTANPTHLRLAAITANFTYESARRLLELVWTVDLPLDVPPAGTAHAVERADIAAAAEFVNRLLQDRFYRDEEGLTARQRKLTARLDVLLATAARVKPEHEHPRFIHSFDQSLYDQIKQRFRRAIDKPRNLLLCGSGFYEEPSRKAKKPAVFAKLEDLGVFTGNAYRVALVDPGEAGAVAAWVRKGATEGWEVLRPFDVRGFGRRLHAKFVYVGYLRNGYTSNGWLYLGSGNLSRRGLLTTGKMAEGNIECGVIFEVDERLSREEIQESLFWRLDAKPVDAAEWLVGCVGDKPESLTLLAVPPILSAAIETSPQRHLRLLWREDALDDARVSISWTGRDWFLVTREPVRIEESEAPAELCVRDESSGRDWCVPVVDTTGHVCWRPPRFSTYSDALAALLDFPIRPAEATDDEEDDQDGGGGTDGVSKSKKGVGADDERTYALYAAADLIERVSALQADLPANILDDWIEHLDRMFQGSFPDALVATWRRHRINVFWHLREPEFRPVKFSSTQRDRYFKVLDRAARSWGLR